MKQLQEQFIIEQQPLNNLNSIASASTSTSTKSTMDPQILSEESNGNNQKNEQNSNNYLDTTFSSTIKQSSSSTVIDVNNEQKTANAIKKRSNNSNNNTNLLGNFIVPKFRKLNQFIESTPVEGSSNGTGSGVGKDNCGKDGNFKHMYAATATNLIFTYGRGNKARKALNGITIKVPVGTIYAILGPSGCGKTTLVHSLVGSIKPKSGYVKVFGEIPGSTRSLVPGPGVGYMPQEIGLFEEFTIKETLFFFGRLYRLPREHIRNRIEFLISFLDLPDKNCFVSKLSGGQKRRVSFAAALVHKPPLLVLDEPTVGIDPVLRQSIWHHLRSLSSKDGITVIITTHYIDEAQYANRVGFMRHGTLLEEGNPQELIHRFQLNNLEEVFLTLCHNINATNCSKQNLFLENVTTAAASGNGNEKKSWIDNGSNGNKPLLLDSNSNKETIFEEDDDHNQNNDNNNRDIHSNNQIKSSNHSNPSSIVKISGQSSGQSVSMITSNNNTNPPHVAQRLLMKRNKILDHFARSSALLTKNFIRMWRNLPVMLFASLIPVLQCTLFFLCLGRNPYDIPVSIFNEELLTINKTTPSSPDSIYSLRLLNEIDNKTIQLFNVYSLDSGFDSVRSGQAKAFLKFPKNFTKATFEKAMDYMSMDRDLLENSFVDLYLDMSSQFHAMKIKEKIFEAYHRFSKKLLDENGYIPEIADSPIRIPTPIMGNENPTVTEFMAPGFIMSLSFFASIATAALTLVLERKDGLLERSLVSGVYPNEYIISHVITQTVVVIIQIILVLLMAFFIFHIPNRGPVFWISVLIVMQGVCGMAYGILISAIAKEENFTLAACMGSMFPQFLLSGVVWPVDTMPQFLIYISTFVSQAKAIDAVRFMLYRGWDPFNHWDVAIGFIISASWTVVFLFIATILFNIHKS